MAPLINLLLLLLLFQADTRIEWTESKKLEWKDFKGQPNLQIRDAAISSAGISILGGKSQGDTLALTITANFNPQKSWVKEGAQTDYLLNHEQTHFNIYELYSRKLKKSLTETKISKQTYKADLDALVAAAKKEAENIQNLYDNETTHSLVVEKQKEWDLKITQELASFQKYKAPIAKVTFK
jgi:hypothetical protein